jgi:hypothetical protein
LIGVKSLTITAHGSDGKVFRSKVSLAVKPWDGEGQRSWCGDCEIYVTPEAQQQLSDEQIWYHLGGFNDDGDTYDTQLHNVSEQLDAFWMRLTGPEEPMRSKLMECLSDLPQGWRSVTVQPDGRVTIRHGDDSEKTLLPPKPAQAEGVEEVGS